MARRQRPAPNQRPRRPQQCRQSGKRKFPDKLAALIALADTDRRGRDELRTYWCRHCRGWHLTSQPLKRAIS